jgi:hypothetical protein
LPKATAARPGAARKLKVYRTPAGFYDAYVAAPSQKAAIEAWGADKHVFARGGAEVVTDEALIAEPLASPGVVIKRKRGSLSEQLAALGQAAPDTRRKGTAADDAEAAGDARKRAKAAARPKPRPSRSALDDAEQALGAFEAQAKLDLAEIRAREAALAKERQALEATHSAQRARLIRAAQSQRSRYDAVLEKWRAELE